MELEVDDFDRIEIIPIATAKWWTAETKKEAVWKLMAATKIVRDETLDICGAVAGNCNHAGCYKDLDEDSKMEQAATLKVQLAKIQAVRREINIAIEKVTVTAKEVFELSIQVREIQNRLINTKACSNGTDGAITLNAAAIYHCA